MKVNNMKYTTDGFNVWAGKQLIAVSFFGSSTPGVKHEVRILQGINRDETIKKICEDCPEFAESCGITPAYYPKLLSAAFMKKEAKRIKENEKYQKSVEATH